MKYSGKEVFASFGKDFLIMPENLNSYKVTDYLQCCLEKSTKCSILGKDHSKTYGGDGGGRGAGEVQEKYSRKGKLIEKITAVVR